MTTPEAKVEGTRLWATRASVAAVFFIVGAANGTWVSRIPAVQHKLALSTGELGLAILCCTAGLLAATPVSGWLTHRKGSRWTTILGALLLCLTLPLPALATRWSELAAALCAFGVGMGVLEVSINTQAVAIEKLYGRPIMSSLHGLFSLGGMSGAALGGLAAARSIPLLYHFIGAALALLVVTISAAPGLAPHDNGRKILAVGESTPEPAFAKPMRALFALGLITFCSMMAEGAMDDWSALYMHRTVHTNEAVAALGFSVFSLCMSAGRFTGDAVAHRLGSVLTVRIGGLCATLGLLLALLLAQPWASFAGFALVGAGLATIVPLAYSAAGNTPGVSSGPAIASVATTGCVAFLVGPPIIGFAAEAVTLRIALGLVVMLCVATALLAPAVRRKDSGALPS